MYKCINSHYGEGLYSTVEAFDDAVRVGLGEDDLEFNHRSDDVVCLVERKNGDIKLIPVLQKRYFFLRDGADIGDFASYTEALEFAQSEFGTLVKSEPYESDTRVRTIYGELHAAVAVDLASCEEELELPETIAATIVW